MSVKWAPGSHSKSFYNHNDKYTTLPFYHLMTSSPPYILYSSEKYHMCGSNISNNFIFVHIGLHFTYFCVAIEIDIL